MSWTFDGLNIARGGVQAARVGLNITGQNITNAQTEGYTRQRVDQASLSPPVSGMIYAYSGARSGQGVQMAGTSQLRDPFLDIQYRTQSALTGETATRANALSDIEEIFNLSSTSSSTSDTSTSTNALNAEFSKLLAQLQGMTTSGSSSSESTVEEEASLLATKFNTIAKQINTEWNQQYENLSTYGVTDANTLMKNIAALNDQIKTADVAGDPALELRDQRNLMIDQLSQYVSVKVVETPTDVGSGKKVNTLSIQLADADGNAIKDGQGNPIDLVDGNQYAQFSVSPSANDVKKYDTSPVGYDSVSIGLSGLSTDGENFEVTSRRVALDTNGKLTADSSSSYTFELKSASGTTDLSDTINIAGTTGESIQDLAKDVQDQINASSQLNGKIKVGIASDGSRLTFTSADNGNDPFTLTVANTPTGTAPDDILSLGATVPASSDTQLIDPNKETGEFSGYLDLLNDNGVYDAGATTTQGIGYYRKMLDTLAKKFADVMNADNSNNETDALGHPTYALFTAQTDTGESTDPNAINAETIRVSSNWTTGWLKASYEGSGGDSVSTDFSNITKMIYDLTQQNQPLNTKSDGSGVPIFNGTLEKGITNIVTTLGQDINSLSSQNTTNTDKLNEIDSERQSVSSVDINEEATNLITYNQALTASARFMTAVDECLSTIINEMGVAGRN